MCTQALSQAGWWNRQRIMGWETPTFGIEIESVFSASETDWFKGDSMLKINKYSSDRKWDSRKEVLMEGSKVRMDLGKSLKLKTSG